MIKTFFKLTLATVLYIVLFMLVNALMPFSEFKEMGTSGNPAALLFLLISSSWACFAIYFVIKHSNYCGVKLFVILLCVMFFIQ